MKNIVLLSIVSIFCLITACSSQKSTTDKDSAESLLQFIPENYSLLDTARGDLNQDGRSDLIMILSKINEQESSDINSNPEKRKLLILLAQEDNSYKEIKSNENVIYCYSCGGMMGDPYQNTTINDNKFVIEFFGGSSWKWARTLTFKYINSESDWYLTEDALVGFHGSDPDNIDTKILTPKDFGEVKFENFDIYNE